MTQDRSATEKQRTGSATAGGTSDRKINAAQHPLMPVAEGREKILAQVQPLCERQSAELQHSAGRVLAQDIVSTIDVPSSTNSAMDGYAIASATLPQTSPLRLRVAASVFAGHPFSGIVAPGECVRIMTGAPLPQGLDSVVISEHCSVDGDYISFTGPVTPGQNRRMAGEDLTKGSAAVLSGTRLGAAEVGLAASLGLSRLDVVRRPRVACFSTGDEIRNPGEALQEGQIYDSNRFTITTLLQNMGMEVIDLGIIADQPEAIESAFLDACSRADMVISSGGVSLGEADFVKDTLERLGQVEFWRLAIKPGRPLAFGQVQQALFFGLPGNPVAAMVTFLQLVRPALQKLSGQQPTAPPRFQARTEQTISKRPGRTEYLRGVYRYDSTGQLAVTTTGHQGSGILTSMSRANCLIVLEPQRGSVAAGETVSVQPFDGLL